MISVSIPNICNVCWLLERVPAIFWKITMWWAQASTAFQSCVQLVSTTYPIRKRCTTWVTWRSERYVQAYRWHQSCCSCCSRAPYFWVCNQTATFVDPTIFTIVRYDRKWSRQSPVFQSLYWGFFFFPYCGNLVYNSPTFIIHVWRFCVEKVAIPNRLWFDLSPTITKRIGGQRTIIVMKIIQL